MPVYLCTEVNEACIAGVNFVIRQPTYEVLHNHNYSCNSVFEEGKLKMVINFSL